MQQVLTLLTNNWSDSNTDSLTPQFNKITDLKVYNFNKNSDVIFAQVPTWPNKPAGIGNTRKIRNANLNIDIRVYGKANEAHFRLVINEVIRILDANITNFVAGWQELLTDGDNMQELSDKSKGMWRFLIPIKLFNYNYARGAL